MDSGTAMGYILDDFCEYAATREMDPSLPNFKFLMAEAFVQRQLTAQGYTTILKHLVHEALSQPTPITEVDRAKLTELSVTPDDMLARGVERSRIQLERLVRVFKPARS
ncbi:MAG TPA: hypothetical protein VJJ52_05775 [Candidatus Nanoarchaeia archaeon]|nr:hypothetical protein [Candidatus Nanoarchaeia archaeon]